MVAKGVRLRNGCTCPQVRPSPSSALGMREERKSGCAAPSGVRRHAWHGAAGQARMDMPQGCMFIEGLLTHLIESSFPLGHCNTF